MFDIQNASNEQIDRIYQRGLSQNTRMRRMMWYAKNIKGIIAASIYRIPLLWPHSVIHEIPTHPESVYKHLEETGMVNFQVMVRNKDESIQAMIERSSFEDYPRLIFTIRKRWQDENLLCSQQSGFHS